MPKVPAAALPAHGLARRRSLCHSGALTTGLAAANAGAQMAPLAPRGAPAAPATVAAGQPMAGTLRRHLRRRHAPQCQDGAVAAAWRTRVERRPRAHGRIAAGHRDRTFRERERRRIPRAGERRHRRARRHVRRFSRHELQPLGIRVIGEIGITGAAAAIDNAVFHACGVRVRELPITVDKYLPQARA